MPMDSTRKRKIIALAAFVLMAGTLMGFFVLRARPDEKQTGPLFGAGLFGFISGGGDLEEVAEGTAGEELLMLPAGYEIYTNTDFGFSFAYPKGFTITSYPQDLGEVILVEKDTEEGFQVFVMPFDEPGPVTAER